MMSKTSDYFAFPPLARLSLMHMGLDPHPLSLGAGVKSLRPQALPGRGTGATEVGAYTSQFSVRGRNASCPAPPAQIPASDAIALGSCLES